jgi:hypothetical protein
LCFVMSYNTNNKRRLSQYKGYNHCINLKFTLEHPMKAQREVRGIAVLSLISALEGLGGQRHASATLPAVKRPGTIPCTGGWMGHSDDLDRCGKSRPLAGFDPRTVLPVTSRYTDWAILAHHHLFVQFLNNFIFRSGCHCSWSLLNWNHPLTLNALLSVVLQSRSCLGFLYFRDFMYPLLDKRWGFLNRNVCHYMTAVWRGNPSHVWYYLKDDCCILFI